MNDYVKTHTDQAAAHFANGDREAAFDALKKALDKEPENVPALVLAAELTLRSGSRPESEDFVEKLFDLDPASFDGAVQKQLGHVCFGNELYARAIQLLEWALDNFFLDGLSLYQLGVAYRRLGNMEKAESRLQESLRAKPEIPAPHLELGHVYKALGDVDRAAEHYRTFIEMAPTAIGTGYWCLADLKSSDFSDDDIAAMKNAMESVRDNPPQLSALHFALGWAAETRKDYAEAMDRYKEGNSIQARLKPFNAEQFHRIVAGLSKVPAQEEPLRVNEKPVAILIVGLPRTGTTLIEQILAAHSRVQATDELPFLEKIALRLEMSGGYPNRLSAMTDDECRSLRRRYLDGVRAYLKQDTDFFIDKYPGNFLHIGQIKRIMPESIIIDARRDPRDVAVSAYRQLFNVRNEFASSFDGIFEYYKGYLAMIRHWKSVYPDQIKTVNYEQLVSSPDEQITALLDFCGLDQEPGCFEFYKQERAVTTPSVSQVSKPMFRSSIGQWQHYEEFAGEEMKRLSSLMSE